MSSLPIRISLLSTGSGNRDPFDDINGYKADEHASDSEISSATFGHRADANNGIGAEANFPLPPTSAGSTPTVYAIGSPADLLQPPGILISFPDSPVSPTFAASGTSSYPRRASVKQPFQPSHERGDEVPLVKDDLVSVISVYEDGWAFVQNEKSNARGLAPLNCLEIDNPWIIPIVGELNCICFPPSLQFRLTLSLYSLK
jgi:Variant SH3 domain